MRVFKIIVVETVVSDNRMIGWQKG